MDQSSLLAIIEKRRKAKEDQFKKTVLPKQKTYRQMLAESIKKGDTPKEYAPHLTQFNKTHGWMSQAKMLRSLRGPR